MNTINTHHMICDFGIHRGKPYTQLPVSYLRWMVNSDHSRKDIAQAELDRRGTTLPEMDVSGHAIDRASQKLLNIWKRSRNGDEGLHAWLVRLAKSALEKGKPDEKGRILFFGIRFVFEQDGQWPVLKTVMPAARHERP